MDIELIRYYNPNQSLKSNLNFLRSIGYDISMYMMRKIAKCHRKYMEETYGVTVTQQRHHRDMDIDDSDEQQYYRPPIDITKSPFYGLL